MFSMKRMLLGALLVSVLSSFALGQEFRGSISGRITESSGATVPAAQITVTNNATNTSTTTTTNESGDFTVLYLIPGQYTLSVEAKGFKKSVRQNIEVRVGDKLNLDVTLEVGGVAETVNITADAPLLETASASAGQVIDRRRISELPLSDGNPFVLSRLAGGIGYYGDLKFSRPFDNNGTSDITSNGVSRNTGHEFTLDGAPNTDNRRVAFVPPADAVQEFKVETASFDAQSGHTAGANVNVTLKSGTNGLHGTAYEFIRNDVLSANDFFFNRAGRERDALRYNRYGGTVGGPIVIPKKPFGPFSYDGRNRSFFFFAFEGLRDVFPEVDQFTVPTVAQRNGDLSGLLAQNITIYDPFTGRPDGSNIRRDPIQCNGRVNVICPERISQVAKNYLQYYPLPNQAGDAQGRNNFLSGNSRTDRFHSESFRFDQTVSEKQKLFFRYTHNNRLESRGNWTGEVNGIRPTGNFLTRKNDGFSYDHVYTFTPSTILDARVGFSRFFEQDVRQHQGVFDPATLGFSSQTVSFFKGTGHLPRFDFPDNNFSELGENVGAKRTHNIYSFQPTLTKIVGDHSFRMGYDFRAYRENNIPATNDAGRYFFRNNFTRGPLNTSGGAFGQEFAALLLGLPVNNPPNDVSAIDRNATRSNQTLYHGIFFQDDWRVNRKLTLNLGVRYEYEGATNERFNRATRGFDQTVSSPVEAAAKAAYAARPDTNPRGLSPNDFRVRGGLLFVDEQNRGFWDPDRNNIQPRIGFAYQINDKTVLRGGYGIYTVPFIIDQVIQAGFSQATEVVPTLNGGLTFAPACATCGNLFNPFPTGVAEPPGSSLGIATFLGRDLEFLPVERRNGETRRLEFSLQRELPGQWVVEAAYVANWGRNLTNNSDFLNAVPSQYLSTSLVRDQATINFLTAQIANPFQGLLPGSPLNGQTIDRQQILRPFPEFARIRTRRDDGSAVYHAGQFRAEKRFSRGFTLLANYTWSKVIEEITFLNESDPNYERRIGDFDIPHRVVISGVWELPFGKGRKWGSNLNGIVDAFIGGWQAQGIFQWQSGRPIDLGNRNVYFNGDPSKLRAKIDGDTVNNTFDTSGFYFTDAAVQTNGVVDPSKQRADQRIRLANNIRIFPSRLPGFRNQNLSLWDLSLIKNFSITERVKFQLRGEFLNAFNHPQFDTPNTDPTNAAFGTTTQQVNLPRNVQIGLKLIF